MRRVISIILASILLTNILCIYTSAEEVVEDTYIDEEYLEYIYEVADIYGIQPEILIAVIERESSGKSSVVSISGDCIGLMQVNMYYHKDRMDRLGVESLYDPYGNILVGTDYLMELANKYEDIASVLMHYHGEKNVESKLSKGNMSSYAKKILDRSHELEVLHYGG